MIDSPAFPAIVVSLSLILAALILGIVLLTRAIGAERNRTREVADRALDTSLAYIAFLDSTRPDLLAVDSSAQSLLREHLKGSQLERARVES